MKNSSDTIGNRTRNLPNCSVVPQPLLVGKRIDIRILNVVVSQGLSRSVQVFTFTFTFLLGCPKAIERYIIL